MLILLNGIIFIFIAIVILISVFYKENISESYYQLAIIIALSLPGNLNLEYLRRYYYLSFKPKLVFHLELINGLILLLFLIIVVSMKLKYPQWWILLGVNFFALSISILIFWYIKFPIKKSINLIESTVNESLQNSLWACGGGLISGLQQQAYVFLLAGIKGTEVVAEANSARLFLSPLGVCIAGINRVFMPRISNINNLYNRKNATKFGVKIMFLLIAIIVVYLLFLYAFFDFIKVFAGKMGGQDLDYFVLLWSVIFIMQAVKFSASQLLQIFGKYSLITITNVIVVSFWFAICVLLAEYYGAVGVVGSMVMAEFFFSFVYWTAVIYFSKENEAANR